MKGKKKKTTNSLRETKTMPFSLEQYGALLQELDTARGSLEARRQLVIKELGPRLLDPLLDQRVTEEDLKKINAQVQKKITRTQEYKEYVSVRKAKNKELIMFLEVLEKKGASAWDALAQLELSITTSNDILALAKEKRLQVNVKPKKSSF